MLKLIGFILLLLPVTSQAYFEVGTLANKSALRATYGASVFSYGDTSLFKNVHMSSYSEFTLTNFGRNAYSNIAVYNQFEKVKLGLRVDMNNFYEQTPAYESRFQDVKVGVIFSYRIW